MVGDSSSSVEVRYMLKKSPKVRSHGSGSFPAGRLWCGEPRVGQDGWLLPILPQKALALRTAYPVAPASLGAASTQPVRNEISLFTFHLWERHGAVGEYSALESEPRPAETRVLWTRALESSCCLGFQPGAFQRLLLQGKGRGRSAESETQSEVWICPHFFFLDGMLLPSLLRQTRGWGSFPGTARNFDGFAHESDNLSHKRWENAECIFFSRKQNRRRSVFEADSF